MLEGGEEKYCLVRVQSIIITGNPTKVQKNFTP